MALHLSWPASMALYSHLYDLELGLKSLGALFSTLFFVRFHPLFPPNFQDLVVTYYSIVVYTSVNMFMTTVCLAFSLSTTV